MAAHPMQPWYRHRWPWLLMSGPAIVVVAGIATAVIAVRTDDGLVAQDYYKRGLEINATLERLRHAEALGVLAGVRIDAAARRVRVTFSSRSPAAPPARLKLLRRGLAAQDRAVLLRPATPGTFEGDIDLPTSGHWDVQVQDERGSWRLDGEWKPGVASLALGTQPR